MEIELTEIEKSLLKEEIQFSNQHRKSQLRRTTFSIILGGIVGGVLNYYKHGYSIDIVFFSLLFCIIVFIPLFIGYLNSKSRIKRLENDFASGFKIVGTEKIESISFFNRKIKLLNGVKVFEPIELNKKFKVGDVINFEVSLSNEFIFECYKE